MLEVLCAVGDSAGGPIFLFLFLLNLHQIDRFSCKKTSSIYQELHLFSNNYLQTKKLSLFRYQPTKLSQLFY